MLASAESRCTPPHAAVLTASMCRASVAPSLRNVLHIATNATVHGDWPQCQQTGPRVLGGLLMKKMLLQIFILASCVPLAAQVGERPLPALTCAANAQSNSRRVCRIP